MLTRRFTRDGILERLRAKIAARHPITFASAGSGLVASLQERAGIDCIVTFSGARLRANGMGTMSMMWPIFDSNKQTIDYTREDILPALRGDAFVCACLNPNDPLKDMRVVVDDCRRIGVAAVSNIGPSIGYLEKNSLLYKALVQAGITLENEIEMLRIAREEQDILTVGLAFNSEDAHAIAAGARPHVFCFHAGITKGGLRGFDSGLSIAGTAVEMQRAFDAVLAVQPDAILMAHGAAMETADDAQYILDHTATHGIWTGSSTERIPLERAITEAAGTFTALRYGVARDA